MIGLKLWIYVACRRRNFPLKFLWIKWPIIFFTYFINKNFEIETCGVVNLSIERSPSSLLNFTQFSEVCHYLRSFKPFKKAFATEWSWAAAKGKLVNRGLNMFYLIVHFWAINALWFIHPQISTFTNQLYVKNKERSMIKAAFRKSLLFDSIWYWKRKE